MNTSNSVVLRITTWFRSLIETLNGGKARRNAEWRAVKPKNPVRVEGGRKAAVTRKANQAAKLANLEQDRAVHPDAERSPVKYIEAVELDLGRPLTGEEMAEVWQAWRRAVSRQEIVAKIRSHDENR